MENPLTPEIEHIQVITPPLYIVAMHRLIKMGKAAKYVGDRNKFVLFDLNTPEGEVLKEKWLPLRNASSVAFIYIERGDK